MSTNNIMIYTINTYYKFSIFYYYNHINFIYHLLYLLYTEKSAEK